MADPLIPSASPLTPDARSHMDAKTRMVVTAAKLFQRQGYHATGLKQVVEEADAPRGSIYHHFPGGKEELGVQAVITAAAELTRAINRASLRSETAGDLLRALGRSLGRWLTGSGYTEGCPISTVVLETTPGSEALRAACETAYAGWVEIIASRLRGQGLAPERASGLATTVISGVLGALLLARAGRSLVPLDATVDELARLLDVAAGAAHCATAPAAE